MLAIYTRISGNKKAGKDTSIEIQTAEGIKVALKLGMKYKIYSDVGISGTKDEIEDRPAFADMMFDIDKGKDADKILAVYVIEQSRLERNPKIWQMFQFQIIKNNIKFYPNGVETNLTDPNIKFATGILSLTNQLFAEMTRIRVTKTFNKRASEGYTHGQLPYGYQKGKDGKFEINVIEAGIVRRIFDYSLDGIGTYTIANILNGDGVTTKYRNIGGKETHFRKDKYTGEQKIFERKNIKWRGNVIYDMIINPVYKGIRIWRAKNEIITAPIPFIIEPDLFDKANRNLIQNKKKVGKRTEFNYLLNGLVFCGCCGSEYRGKKRLSNHDSSYKCIAGSKCPDSRGISIIRFENFIIQHLFINKNLKELLLNLPVNSEHGVVLKKQLSKNEAELAKKIKLESKYLKMLSDDELSDDEKIIDAYKQAKRDIKLLSNNIDVLKQQILESDNNFAKLKLENTVNEYQLTSGFDDTKRLIHSLIERVIVTHQKLERGGVFFIQIKYKGFDEVSTFKTDWFSAKWDWLNYYRTTATNEQQHIHDIQERKDYFDFRGIEYTDADFEDLTFDGQEIVTAMHDEIKLDNDSLISFN